MPQSSFETLRDRLSKLFRRKEKASKEDMAATQIAEQLQASFGQQQEELETLQDIEPPKIPLFWLFSAFFIILVFLLFWIEIEAVVGGQGTVEPSRGIKPIESQNGGIVEKIFVKEGERVTVGQDLITLSNIEILTKRQEVENEIDLLRAKKYRLLAERDGIRNLQWPEDFDTINPVILRDQKDIFLTRRSRWTAELDTIAYEIKSLQKDLTGARSENEAVKRERKALKDILDFRLEGRDKGWVSKSDVLAAESQYAQVLRDTAKIESRIPSLENQIAEVQKKYSEVALKQRQEVLDDLEEVSAKLQSLESAISEAVDKDERRFLKAPINGIINKIHVTESVDVVQPGEPILDIVPLDQGIVVEARIDPSMRRGLYEGLPAKVEFTALQDLRSGGIDAQVIFVAADTQTDEEGRSYYEVHVETESATVSLPSGQQAVIEPGMQAAVSIIVGQHTIGNFLLRPLQRTLSKAFRER